MRLFTMIFLPGILLGCGRALAAYDPFRRDGLDLSFFGLTDEQFALLLHKLATPYYCAAALAMFALAMVLHLFCGEYPILVLLACLAVFVLLEIGTLAYLYHVVKKS